MFRFKNLGTVLLSIGITLLLCAVIATPAFADGGEGEVPILEPPPETEVATDTPVQDPDTTTIPEEQNDGIEVDDNGEETDPLLTGSEPEQPAETIPDPLLSETEELTETNPNPLVSETEDPAEAAADPLLSEPEETEENTPDQAEPTVEAAPVEGAPDAVADTPPSEESTQTQEASDTKPAETILTADPIWCPAGVSTPIANAAGCTNSYTNLTDLFAYLFANEPSIDGRIWIEKTYDSSVNDIGVSVFQLNGSTYPTFASNELTIQGGWDGLGTKTIDTTDPSEINASFQINDWENDVIISDIEITGVSTAYGLVATSSKKITLTRVQVDTNTTSGAYIDNIAGTSDVVVTDSKFNNNSGTGLNVISNGAIILNEVSANSNSGTGLVITSNGAINLKEVSANSNGGSGAVLHNDTAPSAEPVIMTSGTLEFNDNTYDGLDIYSKGAVNLKDITAVGNGDYGAFIVNTAGTSAGVTLSGANIFSENTDGGLYIQSYGTIKGSNIIANANSGGFGALLQNQNATSAKKVILSGLNEFKFNEAGLIVDSKGPITLSNITASNNSSGFGGNLNNTHGGSSSYVTLTGVNNFSFNSVIGLQITSGGVIKIANLTANDNGWGGYGHGANLNNDGASSAKAVILSGINNFYGNNNGGLVVNATGPIELSKATASWNQGSSGISLTNNTLGSSAPQNVTLSGFTTTEWNDYTGLQINSYGNIIIRNLTANENGVGGSGNGATLNNYLGDAIKSQKIVLSGTNELNWNASEGLIASSFGSIIVSNIHTDGNGASGVNLYNDFTGAAGSVSVKGISSFNENTGSGLYVYSNGNILVQNIDASGNEGYGANLYNTYPGKSGNVTVGTSLQNWCNGFSENDNSGLTISSNGAVTLSNMCAYDNGDPSYGVGTMVDNSNAASPKPVTLKGFMNDFNGNYSGGLVVYTRGVITASNLMANDNRGDGAYLDNDYDAASPQKIVLTGWSNFYDNDNYGLRATSYGAIAAKNLSAGWNGSDGVYLSNQHGDGVPNPITVTGSSWFESNALNGFAAYSLGAIKASNLHAYDNGGFGVYLMNSFTEAVGGINVLGTSDFSNNADSGLEAWSRGSILVKDIDSTGNGSHGVRLNNEVSGTKGNITLGTNRTRWCNTFSDNYYSGLEVTSNGVITLSNVCARYNGSATSTYGYGIHIDNNNAASPRAVNLKGLYNDFVGNYSGGLDVYSLGPITASNIDAGENGGNGVGLYNNFDPLSPQNVTITGQNNFWNNTDNGLWVSSYGLIKGSNLSAEGNGTFGAYLDNYGWTAHAARSITLTGTNTFNGNGSVGLHVYSWGAVKASNVTANWNDQGVYLNNQWGTGSIGGITLSGVNMMLGNTYEGLLGRTHGPITISNLTANWNGSDGAYLDSDGLTSPQKVTFTGTNTFMGNGDWGIHSGSGLTIYADGQITIRNLTATGNADYGAYLDNNSYWKSGTPGIILTGTNTFNDNYRDGLYFNSVGPVTLSKVTADGNGDSGVFGYSDYKITILSGSMTFNGLYGWYLWSPDVVTLKGVFAYGNSTNGYLDGGGTLVIKRI